MERVNKVPRIAAYKASDGRRPLTMVTAYDAPTSRAADHGGVDMILVGDSVANAVLGFESTLSIGIEEMVHHTSAVCRVHPEALVVADLPWLSYHQGWKRAVRSAGKLIKAGAKAVKLEGGRERREVIEALLQAEIPVMGHLGLTPQSVNAFGGMVVQAKTIEAAGALLDDAQALAGFGVFAMVLEGVPSPLARVVTRAVPVPTIGIGAGAACDGQVLVFHDLVGFSSGHLPRFVKPYGSVAIEAEQAIAAYVKEVTEGIFPDLEHSYTGAEGLEEWASAKLSELGD